jgi:hypothetical protein
VRKLGTMIVGLLFGGGAVIAPAMATTGDTTSWEDYSKHAADCLALLFTDPKAHAEHCGGPNFVVPDPPHGSTGFAPACNVVEIDPFGIDGVQYQLEASPLPYCCNASLMTPAQWGPLGGKSLVWGESASRGVVVAVC